MSNKQNIQTSDLPSIPEAYAKRVENEEVKSPRIDMTGKTKEEVDAFLLADHKQWTAIESIEVTL